MTGPGEVDRSTLTFAQASTSGEGSGRGGVDWSATARSAVAHVVVDDIEDPRLAPDDAHHLARVLRVRPGETVSVTDGKGGWRPAVFATGDRLDAVAAVVRPPAPFPPITIAMAVVKGDRPEWAVQKLTELGADRIIALVTAHGVVRWDPARSERNLARWRVIARQAVMQSRRLWLPVIEGPVSVADIAARVELRAAMAQPGGPAPVLDRPTVLIGPEGGWAPGELDCGLPQVGLVPTVLRSETAALVAATLLSALRAGTVRPA